MNADVWGMTEAEVLARCVSLGHEMEPDHCGHTRFTCASRVCGRAAVNAGYGWYGSATEKPCAAPVSAVEPVKDGEQ